MYSDQHGRPPRRDNVVAMADDDVRTALEEHWASSDVNDFDTEHRIYRADAVLEYPQSGERIRGRDNIQASREAQPSPNVSRSAASSAAVTCGSVSWS